MVIMLEANKHMSLPDMTGDVWVRRSTAYSIASYTQLHDNGDDGDNVEDDLDVCESIFVKTEIWRQKTVIRDCWSLFVKKGGRHAHWLFRPWSSVYLHIILSVHLLLPTASHP